MKALQPIAFDLVRCRAELDRFGALLASKVELSERADVQPLFKSCPQLATFIGATLPGLFGANRYAFEFDVFGNYTADLLIGHSGENTFCAVEFEDAREHSVLHQTSNRAQKEWGRRLEHGFGQLIDWFYSFDDHKSSSEFTKHFGFGHVEFHGVLLVGRSAHLTEYDRGRLRWRSGRVQINTFKVHCWTYDELYHALDRQLQLFAQMGQQPEGAA